MQKSTPVLLAVSIALFSRKEARPVRLDIRFVRMAGRKNKTKWKSARRLRLSSSSFQELFPTTYALLSTQTTSATVQKVIIIIFIQI